MSAVFTELVKAIGIRSQQREERKAHRGVHLDLILRPWRELTQRALLSLALDREPSAVGGHGGHPNVRVRRITHSRANCDALELTWQDVEHDLSRDERGRAERDGQHVARAIVVAASL